MSQCCSVPQNPETDQAICRECGHKGQSVLRKTLERILKDECRNVLQHADYLFCTSATCQVVYFSNETQQYFRKGDVRVRVGIKETDDPVPVCYCFDYTRDRIFREIRERGASTALPYITEKVKTGQCQCETENPSGRCCLGEVKKTVKAGLAISGSTGAAAETVEETCEIPANGEDCCGSQPS